jgi:hypothetical protein
MIQLKTDELWPTSVTVLLAASPLTRYVPAGHRLPPTVKLKGTLTLASAWAGFAANVAAAVATSATKRKRDLNMSLSS